MLKKHSRLLKFSAFLLALAPTLASRACVFMFIGEPKLPEKLKNN
ncbi:MAG: AgrD family cyclic lactone autoinducer peptide [Coprobacillaceae bacterium]